MKQNTTNLLRTMTLLSAFALGIAPIAHADDPPVTVVAPPAPVEPRPPVEPAEMVAHATALSPIEQEEIALQNIFTLDGYDGFGDTDEIATADKRVAELDKAIAEAKASLATARKSGDQQKITAQEYRVSALEKAKERAKRSIERARRFAPIQKKVDVKFENATVAQAAEALSKASGLTIKVDDGIPDSTRLTVEARKIRLATVLESVARQANLTIEPINLEGKGDLGVNLVMPPMLRVNDTVQRFPQSPSPWSDKWGTPPTRRYQITWDAPEVYRAAPRISRAYGNGVSVEALGNLDSLTTNLSRLGERLAIAGTGVNTTNQRTTLRLSSGARVEVNKEGKVTITESAKNDKGESGHYTTIYTLKNGELVQQSRVWEKDK